jgi:hypothetical protein
LTDQHPRLRDKLRKPLPPHVCHREKKDAVDLLDRVDGHDVGMIERRESSRLAFETLEA